MTDFDDRMRLLRQRFAERALEDRAALLDALAAGDLPEVRRIVHSLAGAGGTFGYPDVSVAAQRIEDALDEGGDGDSVRPLCNAFAEQLAQLR